MTEGDSKSRLKLARSVLVAFVLGAPAAASAQDRGPEPAEIRVYDASELTLDRYTVVRRLWAGTWRASFWVPTSRERADAIEAIKSAAANAGADGVINLHCLTDAYWADEYFCYALAIKLKPPVHGSTTTPRTAP